jgi:hypothetical protein
MITLSGQRFVGQRLVGDSQAVQTLTGVSHAGETRGERSERVDHAMSPADRVTQHQSSANGRTGADGNARPNNATVRPLG